MHKHPGDQEISKKKKIGGTLGEKKKAFAGKNHASARTLKKKNKTPGKKKTRSNKHGSPQSEGFPGGDYRWGGQAAKKEVFERRKKKIQGP